MGLLSHSILRIYMLKISSSLTYKLQPLLAALWSDLGSGISSGGGAVIASSLAPPALPDSLAGMVGLSCIEEAWANRPGVSWQLNLLSWMCTDDILHVALL